MAYQRKIKLYLSEPAQRYFIILQSAIFLATLVFLFAIIFHDIGDLVDPLTGTLTNADMIIYDKMVFSLFVKIALLFGISFLLNALLGLFFLERLTGPMIRIQKVLEEIGKGKTPNISVQIRRGDYPQDVAKALASAVSQIKKK